MKWGRIRQKTQYRRTFNEQRNYAYCINWPHVHLWRCNGKSCRHTTTYISILFFISVELRFGIVILLLLWETARTVLLLKKKKVNNYTLLQLQDVYFKYWSFTSEFQLLLNLLGGVHWYGEPHDCLGLLYLGELQPRPRQLCVTGDGCGLLSYTRILSSSLSTEFLLVGSCGEESTFCDGVLFDGVAAFLDLINGDLYFKLIFTRRTHLQALNIKTMVNRHYYRRIAYTVKKMNAHTHNDEFNLFGLNFQRIMYSCVICLYGRGIDLLSMIISDDINW